MDLASRVAQSTFGDRAQTTRSRLSGIEHHILVLVIDAALGSNATIQEMRRNDAKTRAAVHDALKAAATPAAVAAVLKISGRTSYGSGTACRCPVHSDDALGAAQRDHRTRIRTLAPGSADSRQNALQRTGGRLLLFPDT